MYVSKLSGQPTQNGEVWWRHWNDLLERRFRLVELEDTLCRPADLRKWKRHLADLVPTENLKLFENKIIFPDLLWFVLRCHQPLQALPHLHQHRGHDVLGQEA